MTGLIRLFMEASRPPLKWGRLLLVLVPLFLPSTVLASLNRPLRVCVSEAPFPPFTHPTQEAPGQRLVRQAVEAQGQTLEFFSKAWKRCLRGGQQGLYDGVVGTAATLEYRVFLAFPRADAQIDEQRALGTTTLVVYRRSGSRANWDGHAFHDLDAPLLYLSGRSAIRRVLEASKVEAFDYARNSEQLALMMLKGRGSLAIDHQDEVERIIQLPAFRGRFEILPEPFGEAAIFFAVGLDTYHQQRALFEAIWSDIPRLSAALSPPGVVRAGDAVVRLKPRARAKSDAKRKQWRAVTFTNEHLLQQTLDFHPAY